jgi:YfiR/HmsC-like
MRRAALGIPVLALLVSTVGISWVNAAEESAARREAQLKAGYLFNFMKFIDWPASVPANLLTVCFQGGQGVRDALSSGIEDKVVGERHLTVRTLSASDTPVGCNVLYLDAAMLPNGVPAPPAGEAPILTVSDAKDFARSGGMIELFTDANHLRFNINVASAQKAGLRISSNLLQLAAVVL